VRRGVQVCVPVQSLEQGSFAHSSVRYITQGSNPVALLKHDGGNENSLSKLHNGHKLPWCNLWLCLQHRTIQLPDLLSLFQHTRSALAPCRYYASRTTHAPGSHAVLEASLFLTDVHRLVLSPSDHKCPCQKAGKNPVEIIVPATS